MRLVKYTLNADGTTPSYITDGGYFPIPNGGNAPQDYDMFGLTDSSTKGKEVGSKTDFSVEIKNNFSDDNTQPAPFIVNDHIDALWNKKTLPTRDGEATV